MERDTSQRKAIRKALEDASRTMSPKEVFDDARQQVPDLGMATVYRTVKGLTKEGWVVPVAMPGEPQRYEVAGKGHHHHFSCRSCGKVFELEGCPGDLGQLVPAGFAMESHEVFIFGRCDQCCD